MKNLVKLEEVKSLSKLQINAVAPDGVIKYELKDSNTLFISVDSTEVPQDNEENFKVILSLASAADQFPSKMHWKLKILNNETGRKPRLSIRMFRKGENVKYRKFICDLDYQSADNDLVMKNIEPSTSSIVIRFKHDLTKNMKFTFSIENVGL